MGSGLECPSIPASGPYRPQVWQWWVGQRNTWQAAMLRLRLERLALLRPRLAIDLRTGPREVWSGNLRVRFENLGLSSWRRMEKNPVMSNACVPLDWIVISHVTGVTLKRLLKVEILKLKQEDSTSRVQHVLGLGCARALCRCGDIDCTCATGTWQGWFWILRSTGRMTIGWWQWFKVTLVAVFGSIWIYLDVFGCTWCLLVGTLTWCECVRVKCYSRQFACGLEGLVFLKWQSTWQSLFRSFLHLVVMLVHCQTIGIMGIYGGCGCL